MGEKTDAGYVGTARAYIVWARGNGIVGKNGVVPIPTARDLIYYGAHHINRGNTPGYVNGIMSALAHVYETRTGCNPTLDDRGEFDRLLARFLLGAAKKHSKLKATRLPLTVPLAYKLVDVIAHANPKLRPGDVVAYVSAILNAVFGMLRTGEFTAERTKFFDPDKTLVLDDVDIQSDAVVYNVRHAKTDKFRQTQDVTVCRTGHRLCPVAALEHWLKVRTGPSNEPIYKLLDGTYVTRARLSTVIRNSLAAVGMPADRFNTYSCRSGGAISASAAGCGEDILKTLGRRKSSAYMAYVQHTKRSTIQGLMARMALIDDEAISNKDHQAYARRFDI